MRYEEKKPKEQKRKWKKNRKKTDREIEEENLTYYEREFKRRSDEYMGSEQWKKDSLSWLRKIYQQGSEFRVSVKSYLPKTKRKENDYGIFVLNIIYY